MLGSGNIIGPFAVIAAGVVLGDRNWVGAHTVIGAPPELRDGAHPAGWPAEAAGVGVLLGHGNVLREGVQIHSGSAVPTTIGDDAFIMNQAYVAHDGRIGDGATLASGVRLGGHVSVGAGANLGLGTVVHQRRSVGAYAMLGMASVVTRDVPAFLVAFGNPARAHRVNELGMSRAGFADADIEWVRRSLAPAGGRPVGDVPEALRPFLGGTA